LVRAAARRLPLRFPAEYLELVRPVAEDDPLRRIAWPDGEELAPDPAAIADPVGESPLKLHRQLIRKYRDRALLVTTARCHFYCRFCFRAGQDHDPSLEELFEAIDLLAEHPEIEELIFSGGDPLVLSDESLFRLLERAASVPSVRRVRIHTRAPVHDPARVTARLAAGLVAHAARPLRVVIHSSHPRELRASVERAIETLQAAGIALANQSVLLAGVNDRVESLVELFGRLSRRGVAPYYLHHPDRVAGTARFRVTIERGLELYRALQAALGRECAPRYVLDLPDGGGKVPVEALQRQSDGSYRIELAGRVHVYADLPQTAPVGG
jgi:lysine 2,3-aminomutase